MWPAPRCQDYSRNKGGKGEKGGYNFNRVIKEVFVGKVTLSKDPRRGAASPVAFIRLGEQGSERRDEQAQSLEAGTTRSQVSLGLEGKEARSGHRGLGAQLRWLGLTLKVMWGH